MKEINLNDVFLIIWHRKWILIVSIAISMVATLFWGFFLVQPAHRAEVSMRLSYPVHSAELHHRGYLMQFFRDAERKLTVVDDDLILSIMQGALLAEPNLPSANISFENHEVMVTFETDGVGGLRTVKEWIPNLPEILNHALTKYYRDRLNLMRETFSAAANLEIANIASRIMKLEVELEGIETGGQFFLTEYPEEIILHPLYSDLARRKGELIASRIQLTEEVEDLERLQVERYFALPTVELTGLPRITSLTPQRRIVVATAGIFGLFVGFFLIYLLSLDSLKKISK